MVFKKWTEVSVLLLPHRPLRAHGRAWLAPPLLLSEQGGGNLLPGHLVVTTPPPVPRPFYPDAAHLVSPVHQDRSWEIWNLHDVKQSVSLLGGVHLLLVSDLLPVHHKHLLLLGTWDSSLTLPFLCSSGSICFLTKKSRLKAPRCTKNLAGPKALPDQKCSFF